MHGTGEGFNIADDNSDLLFTLTLSPDILEVRFQPIAVVSHEKSS